MLSTMIVTIIPFHLSFFEWPTNCHTATDSNTWREVQCRKRKRSAAVDAELANTAVDEDTTEGPKKVYRGN